MSGKLSVTARQTRAGIVYDVYFWHADDRIRFTISDASSYTDAHDRATQIQEGVLAGRLAFRPKRQRQYESGTFGSFRPMYEKELKAEKLVDMRRPLGIVDTHLLLRWGQTRFEDLTRQHGLDLILDLRSQGYEEQGIRRVINTARRYVNLAKRHGLIASNPFDDLPLQPYVPRDRIASVKELRTLLSLASPRMQRAIVLAFNMPLRQELIIGADRAHLYKRKDGWWYRPPKAPSLVKGRPLELPLNEAALKVLLAKGQESSLVFGHWPADQFRKSWRRLTRRAGLGDLHFHDLRRNCGSALQEAHIHPGVTALLLGHKTGEVSDIYKTFDSWRPDLRKAATVLGKAWLKVSKL